MPKGSVYLVRTRIAPEREAEWDAWHRGTHVPRVLSEPGFRRARRIRLVEGEDDHRYWTLYDLESVQALQSYRQGLASVRLGAEQENKFGAAADLQRSTFEVLDDLRSPIAPSEVAAVGPSLSLLLRPAVAGDENAVVALLGHGEVDESAPSPPLPEEQTRASFRQYLADPDSGLFVAEVGGHVVAFASATIYPTMRFGRRGHVEDVCVEPAFRRKGVAHRLLDYVERWARREGATHLSSVIGIHRENSRRFLNHEGYSDASLTLRKHGVRASPPTP